MTDSASGSHQTHANPNRGVVWLVNPYGPIPGEGWRRYRFAAFGEALAAAGYSVVWWTSAFSHHFKRRREFGRADIQVCSGFKIRLVPATSYRRNLGVGRLVSEATFAANFYLAAMRAERPFCVITTDNPQVVAYAAAKTARRFGSCFAIDVMDLWPELFRIALPTAVRRFDRVIFGPLYALRKHTRKQAVGVTGLCETYLDSALADMPHGGSAIPHALVYNGIDVEAFRSISQEATSGKKTGDVEAVYAGTLGNNYDIPTVLRAARLLQQRSVPVRIAIAGAGPLRQRVESAARDMQNIRYLGQVPHHELAAIYRGADIGLCLYDKESNVGMPDKAYDYMAAGLPIISSLSGDLRRLIQRREIGAMYEPGNEHSLAHVIEQFAYDSEFRHRLARNAWSCALDFDSKAQMEKLCRLIEAVAAVSGVPQGSPVSR